MGYQYELSTVLLEGWELWSTGTGEIPGKNLLLKSGKTGSILVDSESITVYSENLESLYEDEGSAVLASADTDISTLSKYLNEKTLQEVKQMAEIYKEYETSYTL